MVKFRWRLRVRVAGGREAAEGAGGCSEPGAVQKRGRVWGLLQSEVRGPRHLLSATGDSDHNGRVPRRLLRLRPYALRHEWGRLRTDGR